MQKDNEAKHSFQLCKNHLEKKVAAGVFFVMASPAQLPDLNPIELKWEKLDQRVWTHCPTSTAVTAEKAFFFLTKGKLLFCAILFYSTNLRRVYLSRY